MTGRDTPPAAGPIRPFGFPAVAEEYLANGMKVRLVSGVPLPVVTAMVVVRAGETASPEGREGVAVLAGDALEGGTKRFSSRASRCWGIPWTWCSSEAARTRGSPTCGKRLR